MVVGLGQAAKEVGVERALAVQLLVVGELVWLVEATWTQERPSLLAWLLGWGQELLAAAAVVPAAVAW